MTDDYSQAERFAELFRAVYLTFHRRDGLLERADDPADRRRTLIWLTPPGPPQ